jgi:hypothetical protein
LFAPLAGANVPVATTVVIVIVDPLPSVVVIVVTARPELVATFALLDTDARDADGGSAELGLSDADAEFAWDAAELEMGDENAELIADADADAGGADAALEKEANGLRYTTYGVRMCGSERRSAVATVVRLYFRAGISDGRTWTSLW